ncbi:MAG TPA: hypothetical protein VHG51_09665 [Longimicrobiaceae bacterium]|nr:hypothetical protein [Longimicrobiaceae bacterium]
MRDHRPEVQSAAHRLAAALVGALFTGCGGWVLYAVPRENPAGLLCGAALMLLGIEALVAAVRRRPPLLAKIGPVP